VDDGLIESQRECLRAEHAIEDLADGSIGRVRWMFLRRHVSECSECGTYLNRMSAVVEALADMEHLTAPEDFVALVMAGLIGAASRALGEAETEHGRRNLLIVVGAAGLGVAVAVTLAVIRWAMGKEPEENLAIGTVQPL
jgi:predicted anti-sigma-YlaC factor YlaD